MKRVLWVALVSGIISGVIVILLMGYVFPSAWFFFLIPIIMGFAIKKFSRIKSEDVEGDESLAKRTGWICALVVTLFVLLTAGLLGLIYYIYFGSFIYVFLEIPFLAAAAISIGYGYYRGVEAITDAYYEAGLSEE